MLSAALASFLVAFALLTARVVNGTDPAIRSAAQAQVVSGGGHAVLRTTPSGRVISEPGTTAASHGKSGTGPASIVTRSSGGPGGGRDE